VDDNWFQPLRDRSANSFIESPFAARELTYIDVLLSIQKKKKLFNLTLFLISIPFRGIYIAL
jgi:hypothetical protein